MSASWIGNPSTWSYAAAAVAFAWLALRLMVQWQPGGKPAMLLAMALSTALGAIGAVIFSMAPALGTWLTAYVLEVIRNAATLGFLLAFLGVRESTRGAPRGGRGWSLLVTAGIVLVVLQAIVGVKPPGVPDLGNAIHQVGFGSALAVSIFGLVLVEQCYRRTPAAFRWHVRPLLLGLAGMLAYDLVQYADAVLFRSLDVDLWAARGIAQAVTVPLFLLTLRRTHDWSFKLSVSRGVLVGSTVLGLVGGYMLLIAVAGFLLREFGGSWGRALQLALIFAALMLLAVVSLSATFRARVRVFVAKHFFTYRYDYREEWLRFTNTLTWASAGRPWEACIQALGDLVESPGGSLWLKMPDGAYHEVARSGLPAVADVLPEADPLPAFLHRTGWVLEISDVISHAANYEGLVLPASIAGTKDAWLIVPLRAANDLVAFVVLSVPRVSIEIDWEVRDLLKTAGRQAGSFLAYAQATEALLEARKFDAFHRMSTFVVHDLKNLIAQLQLLLSNVERHRDNPDFQRDMLATIEHVVGRMHQLTLQLRPEASARDRPQPVDVGAVVRRVHALRASGRPGLSVDAPEGILAWAHEDLLERVVSHWVQNAFDASGARPEISVRVDRADDGVRVEVKDHGAGMTAEFMRDRLFKPFQSTKEAGMGIGAFESQQYLQKIGGRIEVQSSPGAGTQVRIVLRPVQSVPQAAEVEA